MVSEINNDVEKCSLGQRFIELRTKANLSIADVATKLCIRRTVISNIENDVYDSTPIVFMRGYINSYARLVGFPDDDLQNYLMDLSQFSPENEMRNFSQKEQRKKNSQRLIIISTLILCALIVVGVYFFWQDNSEQYNVSRYSNQPNQTRING